MRGRNKLKVEFHPESHAYFEAFSETFPNLLDSIQEDFKSFINYLDNQSDTIPDRFGRFGPYTYPASAFSSGLMHVHICVPPRKGFTSPYLDKRACRRDEPERDAALVYVQHLYDEDHYCLLAMLYPQAHRQSKNNDPLMQRLANMAQGFRES